MKKKVMSLLLCLCMALTLLPVTASAATGTGATVTITYADGTAVTNPKVGDKLYAKVENAPAGVTLTYKWSYFNDSMNENMVFSNGTNSTYTLMDDAVGCKINVTVYKDNDNGTPSYLCASGYIATPVVALDGTTNNNGNNNTTTGGVHRVPYHAQVEEKADSPKTADAGLALYAALAVSSLMGMGYTRRKKR